MADVANPTGFVSHSLYNKSSKRDENITHAVARFIARATLLLMDIKKLVFKQLLATFDPQYKVPG